MEFGAAVYHDGVGQAAPPPHTLPQHHHARPITRLVKRKIKREDAPRVGVHQDGQPRAAQYLTLAPVSRRQQLCVHQGMVDVRDLPGAIPMSRRRQVEFPVEGFLLVRRFASSAPSLLLISRPVVDTPNPGFTTWGDDASLLALVDDHPEDDLPAKRPELFVLLLYELQHDLPGLGWEFERAIAAFRGGLWQQTYQTIAVDFLGQAIVAEPSPNRPCGRARGADW